MTSKVCPNCGCERFEVFEYSSRVVILDGNRNHIGYSTPSTIDETSSTMQCSSCHRNYTEDDLITESEFHEITSEGDYTTLKEDIMNRMTHEQRKMMWASQLTLAENTIDTFHVLKDRGKRFSGMSLADMKKNITSDLKTLIIYKDGTTRANFSL